MEKSTKILASLSIILGIALAFVVGIGYQAWIGPAYSSPSRSENTLSLTGYGSVTVEPDRAKISLTISSTKSSAKDAVSTVASMYEELCRKLNESGLDWRGKTTGYSIYPIYEYHYHERVLKGYKAEHSLLITVLKQKDLGIETGEVIDIIPSTGNNVVNWISFTVGDEELESLKEQAMVLAMKDAMHKADLLSSAGNFKLIELKSVSTEYRYPTPIYKVPPPTSAKEAQTILAPSTFEISASVSVTYVICRTG